MHERGTSEGIQGFKGFDNYIRRYEGNFTLLLLLSTKTPLKLINKLIN